MLARRLNTWDKSDPDFRIVNSFHKANVLVIGSTCLDSDPLMSADFIVFRLVVLVDGRHLLDGQQDEGVKYEMQVRTCLLHVNLLESFHKDVTFC